MRRVRFTDGGPRRAKTLAQMRYVEDKLFPREERDAAVAGYRPREGDVVIAPFTKCGTTWLQQMFHTLRTGGDDACDDIAVAIPWIEASTACALDLEADQPALPRGFKSHLPYDALPRGARYVVALRDPRDALISLYRFLEGWFFEPYYIDFEDFTRLRIHDERGDYWGHLLSWWAQRDNPDVLLLSYEGLEADPESAVRRLAAFCGIPLDERLLALTMERSSRDYMLRHKDRFDDRMIRALSEIRCNLPPGGDSAKVRPASTGPRRKEITPALEAELGQVWAERIAPVTGHATYEALEQSLRIRTPEVV